MKKEQTNEEILNLQKFADNKVRYIAEKVERPDRKLFFFAKRSTDIVCALLAMILLLAPMLVIALIIRADSPGSPIFRQVRLGLDQKPFVLYKFRSMRMDAERDGAQWAVNDDPRVTRIGRFLRKTRIDELPQLVNILKGDMSIVGPRPERPEFYDVFDTYITGFRQRMFVKPGLTGLAQINGGYSLLPEEKIVYDLDYIKHLSLRTDAGLILKTVLVVLHGDEDRSQLGDIRCCKTAGEVKEAS